MMIKQLSIFLENKAGRLAHITDILGKAQINLLALSLADSSDFGILRVIVDDVARAQSVLKENNVVCAVHDVLAVEVEDRPGGLAQLLALLVQQGINVEYMYAFSESKTGRAAMVFRFDAPEKALAALQKAGVNIFSPLSLR